jgi:AcrR family transcriptional regulator
VGTTVNDAVTARDALIEAALELLQENGFTGVQARTVTAKAGLTTMALYTQFGGLPGLMAAVCNEGFARLAAQLREVHPTDDPIADLFSMALMYRRFALDNPNLYDLLFGRASKGAMRGSLAVGESGASPTAYRASFSLIEDACGRAIAAGRLREAGSAPLAAQTWAFVHGFVALELGGHLTAFQDPLREVLAPLAVAYMTGHGDDHQATSASAAVAMDRIAPSRSP